MFEIGAEAAHGEAALPAVTMAAALKAVAAQKSRMFFGHVAETRHINSIRTVADRHFVFIAGKGSDGTRLQMWSIRLRPTCPLELAKPSGNSGVAELSRMRADSIVEAHRKTMRP